MENASSGEPAAAEGDGSSTDQLAPSSDTASAAVFGRGGYWLTRAAILRGLGAIYFVAFVVAAKQSVALVGAQGIYPARAFLEEVRGESGGTGAAFVALPGVFWFALSDGLLRGLAWTGAAMGAAVAFGFANVVILALLWFLYMSFVHVGQLFWSYGWEILLLEAGFLAIFLCPALRGDAFPARTPPPRLVMILFSWLAFRVMFGAGLIKMRGDPCWRDLTCLEFHYETQPLPNPLSWVLHQTPPWFHRLEVLWNHFIELVVPFGLFGPRRVRTIAGLLTIGFQVTLLLSGNLSWLNYLTIVVALACLDDATLALAIPRRWRARLAAEMPSATPPAPRAQRVAVVVLAIVVGVLSIRPALNLLSARQVMNDSFDPLHLVNTYGAFGSVGRERNEVILAGTFDDPASPAARWQEYELPCKPGDVRRRPCIVAPYQLRLDWQIWFAAMSDYTHEPWLVHVVAKLLRADPATLTLFTPGPFHAHAPRAIRADLYRYRFTRRGSPGWWTRERVSEYLRPLTADDPALLDYLRARGW
jgi:hypothetical protein